MTAPTLERLDELIETITRSTRPGNGAWVALALGTDDYNDLLTALRAYRETLTPAMKVHVYNINQFACGQYNIAPDTHKLYFGPEGGKS